MKKKDQCSKANDLFLLMFNLSHLTSGEKIIDIFVNTLKEIWPDITISYHLSETTKNKNTIEISVSNSNFGYISIENTNHAENNDLVLINNAVAMLAIVLKKNEQDKLLANEKLHLQKLVEEKIQVIKESEENFRNIFEHSVVGISMTTLDGKMHTNKSFSQILGYSEAELLKLNWREITHKDDLERTNQLIEKIISGEMVSARWEKRYIHKKGNIVWVDISTTLQRDKDDNPLYFITTINNITDRKHAEEALHSLSLRQEALLFAVPEIIMEVDNNKTYTWANKHGLEFFGEDVVGHSADFYFEGEQDTFNIVKPLFNDSENMIYIESLQRRKDGEKRLLAWYCTALKDRKGNVTGALSSARDITELNLAEEVLREREQNYRTLADSGQALIWTAGTDKLCDYFNKVWLEFTGRTLEQEMGNGWTEGVHPDDMQYCLDIYLGAFDRHEKFSMEYRLKRHDGQYRWILDDGCPRYNSMGAFIGYIGHCLDITERKEAEIALATETTRRQILFDQSPDGILVFDPKTWQFVEFNAAAHQQLGYSREEFSKLSIADVEAMETPEDIRATIARMKQERRVDFETLQRTKDDKIRNVYVTAQYIDVLGYSLYHCIWRDITDQKRAQAALRESEDRYRTIVSNIPGGLIHIFDREMKYVFNAGEELTRLGLSNEYLVGKSIHDILPADVAPMVEAQYRRVLQGETVRFEGPYGENYFSITSAPLFDATGKVEFILTLSMNITEQKRSDEILKEKMEELQRFHSLTVGRELTMIELKKEVNALRKQSGQEEKYKIVE